MQKLTAWAPGFLYLGGIFNSFVQISEFKVASSTVQVQQGEFIVQPHCKVIGIHSPKVVSHCKHFAKCKKSETGSLKKGINTK